MTTIFRGPRGRSVSGADGSVVGRQNIGTLIRIGWSADLTRHIIRTTPAAPSRMFGIHGAQSAGNRPPRARSREVQSST